MSGFAQMGHDELVELWMGLDGENTPGHVESLNATARTISQVDTSLGHFMDDVAVHLMKILRESANPQIKVKNPYNFLLIKQRPPTLRQTDLRRRNLPTLPAPNTRVQCPREDLMPKADTDYRFLVALHHIADVLGQQVDPSVIAKRIVFYQVILSTTDHTGASTQCAYCFQ